jgi:hypothetical protein
MLTLASAFSESLMRSRRLSATCPSPTSRHRSQPCPATAATAHPHGPARPRQAFMGTAYQIPRLSRVLEPFLPRGTSPPVGSSSAFPNRDPQGKSRGSAVWLVTPSHIFGRVLGTSLRKIAGWKSSEPTERPARADVWKTLFPIFGGLQSPECSHRPRCGALRAEL